MQGTIKMAGSIEPGNGSGDALNPDRMRKDDSQKVALVTGASRGIGRAVALELAKQGMHVIALARAQKALESLDDDIQGFGGTATLVPFDLKEAGAFDGLGATIFQRWGRLDALISCAGILGGLTPVSHLSHRQIDEGLMVNLAAHARLIRVLDPLLRLAPAARAVFVTSNAAHQTRPFWGLYAAAKAGLEVLVQTYAEEIAITPIRVNLFDPGPTRTPMRALAYPGEDVSQLADPQAVAQQLVRLLASTESRHGERIRYDALQNGAQNGAQNGGQNAAAPQQLPDSARIPLS